ncbi:btk-binding protein-related [Anaeramoeba ignava]|uniref:Btk-binding protein-related n=1 Tax=Anaeramoeba ignava TaxID=1746090 RepID=A0A9Q0LKN8_ANAIG|nr:btk-binding protein-related [Anaeramoeba ignava]
MNDCLFFGLNQNPILFKNKPEEITKPIQFKFENENENENENEKQIKQISSSDFSTIFLFENGKAIEYLNENDSKQKPEKIQIEENIQKVTVDRIIEDIVSGFSSIYLLTSNQNAYGIGDNYYGQFGINTRIYERKPILMMRNVSKIFSGNTSLYVFLLNSNQELFGCGYNGYGQLGLGKSIIEEEEEEIKKLTKIQNIPKGKIIDIQCGSWHSVMLIENEDENPKRKLYSCGYWKYNLFGKNTYEFTEIKSSLFENDDDNDNIIDFSVGNEHTLILTSKGKFIVFGNNRYGQLGTEDTNDQLIPIQIELPKLRFNEEISNYHISCGFNNSFLYYSPFSSFSNLEEDLIKLFRRKEFCDISFKTKNGEIIEAHKLILKYRLNQNQNEIEKLQEIISKKSIQESNQIFEMIYSNNSKINPKLYSEIKEIINSNEKIEETIKRIYLNENEKDFIIERKEKQYKFPKLILIMRSELYRGMFLSVTEDTSNKVTDYSELSNKSFQIFEYWIYSNQIKDGIQITQEIINEIQIGIDYFQLNQTHPNLFDLLIKKFNNQNYNNKEEKKEKCLIF